MFNPFIKRKWRIDKQKLIQVNKELIVRSGSDAVDFALTKDGKLIELHKEEDNNDFSVGDIFLAKIRKPVTGLNAAFVNVGYEKDAFLHYHDLGPQLSSMLKFVKKASTGKMKDFSLKGFPFEKDIDKNGVINDVIKTNQSLLVQIVKEPISTKGPRISSELSLAGRYVVMVPFSDRVSVSQKIESREEKDRLKRLVRSIKPKGFGVIIRTVAEGKKVAELDKDLENLLTKWSAMCKKLYKAHTPSKVLTELNRASSILRDVFNDSYTGIHVDNETLYNQIKDYVLEIAPAKDRGKLVGLYQFNIVFGILVAFLSNYLLNGIGENAWRWMLGVEALPALVYGIIILYVPQSPRWLVIKGRYRAAIKTVELLNLDVDIKELQLREINPKRNENIFSKKYRLSLLLVFFIAFFNQFSGINALLYYAPRIFEEAGLGRSSALLSSLGQEMDAQLTAK